MPKTHPPALSLPRSRTVRGYKIRRLALGRYFSAMQALQDLPGQLMDLCFPGETLDAILARCRKADAALLGRLLDTLLQAAPQLLVRAAAELTGIPEERLLGDEAIGLDGLVELILAWVEVNRLEDFIPAARRLRDMVRTALGSSPPRNSGCSA